MIQKTKFYTNVEYIDVETGEVLNKKQIQNKEYIITNIITTTYERQGKYTTKTITRGCNRTKQLRIFKT